MYVRDDPQQCFVDARKRALPQDKPVETASARIGLLSVRVQKACTGARRTCCTSRYVCRLVVRIIHLQQKKHNLIESQNSSERRAYMQVADVLSDREDGAWIDMLARRVRTALWADSHCAARMVCALLTPGPAPHPPPLPRY